MARTQRAVGGLTGGLAGALLAASVMSAPQTPGSTDPEVRRLKPGVFLYASPSMRDSNFSETVVLLVEHGSKGAMGLVINRPTEWTADEALKDARALHKLVVHWGGPVQPDAVFGLIRAGRPPKGGVRVLDGVFLTGKRKDLDAAVRKDETAEGVRVYAGYSGWGAGQLEREILQNGWFVAPADADSVFSARPEGVWQRVRRLQERLEARTVPALWQHPGLQGSIDE